MTRRDRLGSVLLLNFMALALPSCGGDDGDTASGTNAPVDIPLGKARSGDGTYYDATGEGACSFDASPSDLDVAALNSKEWSGSAYCGACADVQGPNGLVRVRIVDLCPECEAGDLDLSPQAFEKIAPLEQGRVPISWQLTTCDVSGNMRYRYKDGSNQWWTAVQVLDHRVPVAKVEWSTDGESFQPLERMDYNYFLAETGFGPDPVVIRITSVEADVVTDELPAVQESLVVQGNVQFE